MNILILNVHSALNLGDDVIMYETLRSLKATYPDATITVAANDPDSWKKYDEIRVVGSLTAWVVNRENDGWDWRKSLLLFYAGLLVLAAVLYRTCHIRLLFGHVEQRRLLCAYYDADLVLSCGGGNFYAHRSISPSFIWSLFTLALAHLLGKDIVLLPQSIGPIEGQLQKLLARLVFDRAARILLREPYSLAFLEELKVSQSAIVLPDLAFAPPPVHADSDLLSYDSGALQIGVTVIDRGAQDKSFSGQQNYEDALVSLLVRLNTDYGAHLHIFSQCYGPTSDQDDRHSARQVYDRVREQTDDVVLLDTFQSGLEIKAAYKHMDCIIGSRMHTGVFALSTAVPVVLIGYQPKAFGVMEMFGLECCCCSIETVNDAELYEMVRQVLDNGEEIRAHIAQRYAQLSELLQGWVRYLQD